MGSTPISATVAVADSAMHWIVAPEYVGSNPIGHIFIMPHWSNGLGRKPLTLQTMGSIPT